MTDFGTRCHRCGDPMTLYVVDDSYCPPCKREMRVRDEQDARRRVVRFPIAKDLTPTTGAA